MHESRPGFEHRELDPNYKQAIREGVKSKDVEQLFTALQDINKFLTGGETAHFARGTGLNELREELEKFIQKISKDDYGDVTIYLGDGGFSRIILAVEDGNLKINLSHKSTDVVKKKWEQLQ